ncbi:hypothetical protein [Hymenobacter elongatus]|uniref:Uncharacterized protein n=1 Tax=Hymenobacter elongatus TaxID=877208 RepID=A0A4Z0PSQ9_9BACT|nr:hypothetical protein [Hymenobacter elongatus]TGE20041.1 hypothetical protein E5J99_00290 [Hymenobacter elongatus]
MAFTAAPTPPELCTTYDCTQLRNIHSDDQIQQGTPGTLASFVAANAGQNRCEVIGQRGYQNIMPGVNLAMRPTIRYIRDPLNPDSIIDRRHMLAVAYYGMGVGNTVEVFQAAGAHPSAYDHQDYFSNQMGYDFFYYYGTSLTSKWPRFIELLQEFLMDPNKRSRNSNPCLINQRCP